MVFIPLGFKIVFLTHPENEYLEPDEVLRQAPR